MQGRSRWALVAGLLALCAWGVLRLAPSRPIPAGPAESAREFSASHEASAAENQTAELTYVGAARCAECHADELRSYQQSAHSQALAIVDPQAQPADGQFDHALSGRTKNDGAQEVADLLDTRYAGVERITLVCDNLNTHAKGAFDEAFPPEKARDYVRRIAFVYTPKHGSWLNVAECELSCMTSPCLSHRRIGDLATLQSEIAGLVNPCQREATGRRLAIHDRQSKGQIEAALPEDLGWTGH